jgi:hypothetical protein
VTDINDLYEPGDDREPGEPDVEPPLDLDAVEESIRVYYGGSDDDSGKAAEELLMVVSRLAAELREARERIAGFEALPIREEWSWSEDPTAEPTPGAYKFMSAKSAFAFAAGRQVWHRTLTVRPWQPISPDAPF